MRNRAGPAYRGRYGIAHSVSNILKSQEPKHTSMVMSSPAADAKFLVAAGLIGDSTALEGSRPF